MSVQPIPRGYHSVTPYLIVDGAAAALDFYGAAFGAEEVFRLPMGARIGHAEMRIGDSVVMLADEVPEMGYYAPTSLGDAGSGTPMRAEGDHAVARAGTPVSLMVYVADVDAVFARALQAGATAERPVQDQFYGDRSGTLIDPFGHRWTVATHVEDVPPAELERRMKAWSAAAGDTAE